MHLKRTVGKYELLSQIGKGSYSQVHKAKDNDTGQIFAIKVIPNKHLIENHKVKQYITNEINAHKIIGKSNFIVNFIELLQTKNNCYFVYEYCEGTLHQEILKKSHLDETEAKKVIKQLISAFKELNKYNIIHRDVKPQNILVVKGSHKLADFGFCKELKPPDLTKTMLGSPLYMAPQILRGDSYDSKTDIWSIGVIFYEMLFGRCPFQSKSIANLVSLIEEIKQINLENCPNPISSETKQIIRGCLEKNPNKRMSWEKLFDLFLFKQQNSNSSSAFTSQIFLKKSVSTINDLRQNFSTLVEPSKNTYSHCKYQRNQSVSTTKSKTNFQIFKENYNKIHEIKGDNKTEIGKSGWKNENFLLNIKKNSKLNKDKEPRNISIQSKYSQKKTQKHAGMKKESIIQIHEVCLKILKVFMEKLTEKNFNDMKYSLTVLKKIRQILDKIYNKITLNNTDMLPILSMIKYEDIQISKIEEECKVILKLTYFENITGQQKEFPTEATFLWIQLINFQKTL